MSEEWITTAEAAEISNYHPETIRDLVREGRVKGQKFGPVWQVSKTSLLEYLTNVKKLGKRRGPKPRLE